MMYSEILININENESKSVQVFGHSESSVGLWRRAMWENLPIYNPMI